MEQLRFAPIIRVSTETQEKQGESLKVQTAQINHYVIDVLKGTIPDYCWQYSGQEHATPGQERQKLQRLLDDSDKGLFDAVIVCDASRWSRDNRKSKEGLDTLKANGIRFFVGTTEYDLFNPTQNLFLGLAAEIGEFQAREQARKGALSRISLAEQGLNSIGGKLPYGRTYDKKTRAWGTDPEKLEIIQKAAERYLNGEPIYAIAKTIGMDHPRLWRIFTQKAGTDYTVTYQSKANNIKETVTIKIPPLLDESTIAAIKEKLIANRTYTRNTPIKFRYLLKRLIFCSTCNKALLGSPSSGVRRYIHQYQRMETLPCRFKHLVKADEIEKAVLIHLAHTFADSGRIQKAIKDSTPDKDKADALRKEQDALTADLKKNATQKEKLIDAIADDVISKDEAKSKLEKIRDNETAIHNRLAIIENTLSTIPDSKKTERLAKWVSQVMGDVIRNKPDTILKKPYEYQLKIIQAAFGGRDAQGNRLGVYMTEQEKGWTFEIRGTFGTDMLSLPLSDEYLTDAFDLNPDYQDVRKELETIKGSLLAV